MILSIIRREYFIICSIIMKIFKKLWIIIFSVAYLFSLNFGFWIDTTPEFTPINFESDSTPKMSDTTIERVDDWAKTFSEKLHWILKLPTKTNYTTSLWYVISLIQISINWLLWILAFVALVYMIYCWFLVFSSGSDDKNAAKGKKWISTAAIALAWIWLSWLIISAMVRFITLISNVN